MAKSRARSAAAPAKQPVPRLARPQSANSTWHVLHLVLAPLLLLVAVFFVTWRPVADPDTWFHMALGKWYAEHGEIPRADPFASSSPGGEWISSGWLSSVVLYQMYRVFGESGVGLLLVSFSVVAVTYLLVWFAAVRWFGGGTALTTLLLFGLGLATVRFNPRPDIFSHLMLACTLIILILAERPQERVKPLGPWYLYLLLPLFAVWANLHAGFPIGLFVLLIYAGWVVQQALRSRNSRRLARLIPVLLPFVCTLVNPYGLRIWALAPKIARIPKVGWILEWMPFFKSGFPMPVGAYLFGALLVLAAGVVLWRTRAEWWRWAIFAMLVGMALLQRRQVGPAAIGICVVLLPSLPLLRASARWRGICLAAAVITCLCVLGMKVGGKLGGGEVWPQRGIDCSALPCVVTDFLSAQRPPEKLFNSYGFGGYMLYHLAPQTKVYIDGRLDVYDPQVYLDALAVEENRISVEEMEKRYDIVTWVLSTEDAIGDIEHLASRLAARQDYALVHFDDQAAVFVKRTPTSAEYISRNAFKLVNPWKLSELTSAVQSPAADTVIAEVDRALQQSQGSANASALAAAVAKATGHANTAQQLLQQAIARQPSNRLVPLVQGM